MSNQSAAVSLLGNRAENQDRVKVVEADGVFLLMAIDGMGGHANGARAAEMTVEIIEKAFIEQKHPIFDPQGFLHLAIGRAHAAVVELGSDYSIETRPRATCALCLIQEDTAYWGHVGDSRIYHLRGVNVHERSRDHSHVESLLYDGAITRDELATHPMRNYVECCLGGDAELPRMTISRQKNMQHGDVMLVCSDGFWAPLEEAQLADLVMASGSLAVNLQVLSEMATRIAEPYSDNTSAAAFSFRCAARLN
ncbi:MAG: serine/threonine-protein phosphatase [Gammaproteobacteria bacterium]|nr:serine/threonine-protein phosphatase [Gammaproteobacteria bacterium]MCP4089937.1 serine/threonine-protein phosphatase [Gammaproteobacteria bacterium]MCP4276268.1 serine/threonine-protein phosphatase [Gammaproteobacteria bacterium]MCP4831263.1 serine/threonine-protein phosphatase [Gammaproteobacteria bacterium]MCP4928746.1 serine/threonine-protein phosphatase [Gammaproteobacteria bacterium]